MKKVRGISKVGKEINIVFTKEAVNAWQRIYHGEFSDSEVAKELKYYAQNQNKPQGYMWIDYNGEVEVKVLARDSYWSVQDFRKIESEE